MTHAEAPVREAAVRATSWNRRREDLFFLAIAILILATVFLGFARTYYLAGVFRAPLPDFVIHLHGAAYSAWYLLFIAQISLIAAGRTQLHRQLGIFGAALAAAMVVLGALAATDALARGFKSPRFPFDQKTFYALGILQVVTFAVLVGSALQVRSDGPAHKRLILIATIGLLPPVVDRLPFTFVAVPLVFWVIVYSFLLLLAGFDLWSRRGIHRATIRGGLFLIVAQQAMVPIGLTPLWHRFATLMMELWKSFH